MTILQLYVLIGLTCATYDLVISFGTHFCDWKDPALSIIGRIERDSELDLLRTMRAKFALPVFVVVVAFWYLVQFVVYTLLWPCWMLWQMIKRTDFL